MVNVLHQIRVKAFSNEFSLAAKTRMKMLTTVTAMKALPHTQLDNQQTAFDSVRWQIQKNKYKYKYNYKHKNKYKDQS